MMSNELLNRRIRRWFLLTFKRMPSDDIGYFKTWVNRFKQGPRYVWQQADNHSRINLKKVFPLHYKGITTGTNLMNEEYMVQAKFDWW